MIAVASKSRSDWALRLRSVRDKFVRSESIDVKVSITNKGSTSLEIEDLTILNNPLHFYAVDNFGKEFSGSLLRAREEEGIEVPSPIRTDLITLEPQEAKTIDVDLLNILGELPEANYRIDATYQSEGILHLRSNVLKIQILKSTPIHSSTFQDYLRILDNPIRTAWINEEEDGLYLLIMENSPNRPQHLRSNRRILKLEKPCNASLSLLQSYGQDVEDLVWREEDIVQRAIVHKRIFMHKQEIKLPIPGFQLLEPLLTDENGKLYFVALSREEDSAIFHLVSCPLDGSVESSEIYWFTGEIEKYSLIFDADLRIHLAWASRSGDIYYIQQDLEERLKSKGEAELLVSGKTPMMELQFSLACFDEDGNRQLILHYLNEESEGKLCSHIFAVEKKKHILDSFFPVPEKKELKLLQVVLDLECHPHFLFQDGFGSLWFSSFESRKLVKVTGEGKKYPRNIDYPMLLVSSNMSRHYGIYMRYVKDRSRFAYKKLEEL